MFSLNHPLVMLSSRQLIHHPVRLLPVSVQIVYSCALEITHFTTKWFQFLMDGKNMFSQVSGISKALITLITHFLFNLHVKLFNMILHSIFSLKQLSTLITRYGGCGMSDHVSVEIPLTAQVETTNVAGVGSVTVHLLHVCLEYLQMFQCFATNLTLNLLTISWHQHLMSVPQVSLE